jgi:hypothetical protein
VEEARPHLLPARSPEIETARHSTGVKTPPTLV